MGRPAFQLNVLVIAGWCLLSMFAVSKGLLQLYAVRLAVTGQMLPCAL